MAAVQRKIGVVRCEFEFVPVVPDAQGVTSRKYVPRELEMRALDNIWDTFGADPRTEMISTF